MTKCIYFGIAVCIMLSGCTTQTQMPTQISLMGEWKSTTSEATIFFDKGRVSGSDGCNRYASSYSVVENNISISNKMMSTMMACESERMKSADTFRQALMAARHYHLDGKKIILMSNTGIIVEEFVLLNP